MRGDCPRFFHVSQQGTDWGVVSTSLNNATADEGKIDALSRALCFTPVGESEAMGQTSGSVPGGNLHLSFLVDRRTPVDDLQRVDSASSLASYMSGSSWSLSTPTMVRKYVDLAMEIDEDVCGREG